MLTEEEKSAMAGFLTWHYTDMPSGFEIVDFYLSRPGVKASDPGSALTPERAMNFIFLGAYPSFTLNFHLHRSGEIPYLKTCLEYIRTSRMGKKTRIFVHVGGEFDDDAFASLNERLIIPLDLWQRAGRSAELSKALSSPRILMEISIKPDAAVTIHDTLRALYRQGLRVFLTRFDPRPSWKESDLRTLERQYERCVGFYMDSLGRRDPFVWDELEFGTRHFLRHASFDCRCAKRIIAFSTNGELYPCRFLLEKGTRSLIVGNLSRQPLILNREIRTTDQHLVQHPLYCRWECSSLHGGSFAEKLHSYASMMERISEKILARTVKSGLRKEIAALPDEDMEPLRPHPQRSARREERSTSPEKDLSFFKQWKGKAGDELADARYHDLYINFIRWQPARSGRRSEGKSRR
jgi:hypothetical protein